MEDTNAQLRRHSLHRRRRRQLPLMATVIAFSLSSVTAFTVQTPSRPTTSSLSFKQTVMEGLPLVVQTSRLPVWLAVPQTQSRESLVNALVESMKKSFFTETETLQLLAALEEAAPTEAYIAGAAEFLAILVETMEMGLNALVAAAFHYVDCVQFYEQGTSFRTNLSQFGVHVSQIAADAARIQQLEWVSKSVLFEDPSDAQDLGKLLLSETRDWRALAIRAGACLYRLRGLLRSQTRTPEGIRMARQAMQVYAPLASRLGMHRLKNELEGSAFEFLYPRQYKHVASMERSSAVLDSVQEHLTQVLEEIPGADWVVAARVKEPYSLWKKMLRNGYKDIAQVPDALALRVILNCHGDDETLPERERQFCYDTQRLCCQHLPPADPPRFKDYIQSPKENGYQSLHYTANIDGQFLEIQVRSGEMHQVAEFGLASHWEYKLEESTDDESEEDAYSAQAWRWKQQQTLDATPASFATLTPCDIWQSRTRFDRRQARTQRLEPYLQALVKAQSDLSLHTFLFVVDRDQPRVLRLPRGACLLDACRQLNQSEERVQLNGEVMSITRQLQNGDILTVV